MATVNIQTTKVYEAILQAWNEGKKGIGLEGGTYSSKTWSALQALMIIAQASPKLIDINIVSESVPHLKGGCIKDFFNIIEETKETSPFFNQSDYIYRRPGWKGVLQFLSADNEKALGMRRDILFINEGDTLSWAVAKELISRTNIFVIVDWNPRTEFWWHKYYKDDPNWAYDHSTYLDALDVLPPGKREDIEDLGRKDENYHLVYELGMYGNPEGLVYPQFNLVETLPAGEPFYGLDYGGDTDPNVLVKNVIIGDSLYSQEMFYLYDQDISQLAREMDLCKVLNSPVYPDPENPLASKELKTTHRFNIQETVSGKGSVKYGIKKVNQYYQYWTQNSLNCIKEQRNYRYLDSEKNEDDRPVTVSVKVTHRWSHGMDARRYAVASVKRVSATAARPVSNTTGRAVSSGESKMMRFNLRLPKQHYIGNFPGRIIFLYANAATVFGMFALFFGASTWFMIASDYFGIKLPIWVFYAALLLCVLSVMVLYWMFVTASVIAVNNEQSCKHQNPVIDKLESIEKRLVNLERIKGA